MVVITVMVIITVYIDVGSVLRNRDNRAYRRVMVGKANVNDNGISANSFDR